MSGKLTRIALVHDDKVRWDDHGSAWITSSLTSCCSSIVQAKEMVGPNLRHIPFSSLTNLLTTLLLLPQFACPTSRQECKKSCPVVKMGKLCIEVTSTDKKAFISEELCIGCGICVKK